MRYPLTRLVLGLFLSLASASMSAGAGPADALLRLVPADAGVTLTIEDLRGHTRSFFASPLAERLGRLPAVRAWLGSDRFKGFEEARRQIEDALGEKVTTIRDELLGDAVVLTLRVPPGGGQDDARGMLLVRVRDRALLDRLIDGVNSAQKTKGELLRVVPRSRGKEAYHVREFPEASKRPAEYYATLGDNTFAWSNSEELVHGVIDRRAGGRKGLGDDPRFRRVRDRLPARSAVSLFVDPRFLTGMMEASPKPSKPGDERIVALFGQYLRALEYAGAALEWRETTGARGPAVILHTEEAIDPEKLPDWLRRWAARPSIDPRLNRVPAGALAVASAHVDFEALLDIIRALTPSSDQNKLDNMLLVLTGLALGRDLRTEILPALGPAVLAYLEKTPDGDAGLALVGLLDLEERPGENRVGAALDNALRTLLAVSALDEKHGGGQRLVESREIGGVKVTAMSASSPFVYAIGRGVLALGGSAAPVARALASKGPSSVRFEQLRAAYFPGAGTFVCLDLEALRGFAEGHRAWVARRIASRQGGDVEAAGRDLDQALALMGLFRDAFASSELASDARSAHRMVGLIIRGPDAAPRP